MLQSVYIHQKLVCVMSDGIDVMDNVGGLYGYFDF